MASSRVWSRETWARIQFLLTDQVGTLRAVADTSGTIVKRIDYDSFGNIIADTNPAFGVPFGFAGGLHDRDTGLVRFGYRDYSPELGRFVAKDPIDFAGGDTNLYAYAMNDPVNLVDPNGLVPPDRSIWFPFEQQLGQLLGQAKNTMPNMGRIVDYLKDGIAWEAKSGAYVYLSSQVRDFLKLHEENFNLVVRGSEVCSGPLLKALVDKGARLYQLTERGLTRLMGVPIFVLVDPVTGMPAGYSPVGSPGSGIWLVRRLESVQEQFLHVGKDTLHAVAAREHPNEENESSLRG